MSDARPIGVFDSGVGGLTVLHELRRALPAERMLYIADLLHFPYGPRYQHEVREYALRIIDHLIDLDAKLVVIACNTASAAALTTARERVDVPVVGVIAPGAQAAVETTRNGRIAVISTAGTQASQEYVHAIKEANPGVGVLGIAAPQLVDVVEEGNADTVRAQALLEPVVDEALSWGADTLVLGCTHYPLLGAALSRVIGDRRLAVVDSAATTAARVARILSVNHLHADDAQPGSAQLLVTAAPEQFSEAASRLFGESVHSPALLELWNPGVPASACR